MCESLYLYQSFFFFLLPFTTVRATISSEGLHMPHYDFNATCQAVEDKKNVHVKANENEDNVNERVIISMWNGCLEHCKVHSRADEWHICSNFLIQQVNYM